MQKFDIKPYMNLCVRRKWWIISPLIFTALAGMVYLYLCPRTYKATTLVLLEPQRIPESYVKSTLTETMEGRLSTINQQISSRTNIERIVKDFHLGAKRLDDKLERILQIVEERFPFIQRVVAGWQPSPADEQLSLDELVQQIRKNLEVHMRTGSGTREQNMSFEISFEWNDQDVVAPVTNAVVARFIEDNLAAREEVASSTTDFLDGESASIRSELEARERELETFRKQNMGMLPDQLQSNISILEQLREQARTLESRMEQERQQAMFLRSQEAIARADRSAAESSMRVERGTTRTPARDTQMTLTQLTSGSLEDLEAELSRLRAMYTEKHPDIIAIQRRIEELKKEGYGYASRPGGVPSSSSRDRMDLQLAKADSSIETYKKQIQEVNEQIELYKKRVERGPQMEVELNKITRGYETVRQRYDALLSRKLDAKMSEELERRKKGAQFRVLDLAVRPPKPFKPDPMKIVLMTLVAGLGLGFGLAYVREMLDPAFYSPEDLETYLKTKVIMSLPTVGRGAR
jgi:polysaccharide chain length determinant protein (PEP-CTERM system associated)